MPEDQIILNGIFITPSDEKRMLKFVDKMLPIISLMCILKKNMNTEEYEYIKYCINNALRKESSKRK
jgi:hypothetical protein